MNEEHDGVALYKLLGGRLVKFQSVVCLFSITHLRRGPALTARDSISSKVDCIEEKKEGESEKGK